MMKLPAILVSLFLASVAVADAPAPKPAPTQPAAAQRIEIQVTRSGFEPGYVKVPAKKPVSLVFTRKTDQTCTKSVVLSLGDGKKIEKDLPLDTPVQIDVTFAKAGKLGYACSMDMNKGVIVVH
jgi:plastocyanin domain-containing protein